jgi:hypothetical protein
MATLEEAMGYALEFVNTTARAARVWLDATTEVVVRWAHDDALPQISAAWQTARTRDILIAATAGYLGAAALAPLLIRVLLRIIGFGPRGPVASASFLCVNPRHD